MICYSRSMSLLVKLDLLPIIDYLVEGGRAGHEIAVDHTAERGSNGFTFGSDRYHRSCEITKDAIQTLGFTPFMVGGGHRARRDGVELWFATAKAVDVHQRDSFDFSTDARLEAGTMNVQPYLDGLQEEDLASRQIVHVVWSGDPINGLTAVHVGKLARISSKLVDWRELERIDLLVERSSRASAHRSARVATTYDAQPLPMLDLAPLGQKG
jgi:hypothetical protein